MKIGRRGFLGGLIAAAAAPLFIPSDRLEMGVPRPIETATSVDAALRRVDRWPTVGRVEGWWKGEPHALYGYRAFNPSSVGRYLQLVQRQADGSVRTIIHLVPPNSGIAVDLPAPLVNVSFQMDGTSEARIHEISIAVEE